MLNKLRKINKGSKHVPFLKRNWLIFLAVAYFFFPIDLIPDVVPAIGLGDDVLVLLASGIIKYLKFHRGGEKKEKIIEGELVD